MFNKSTIFQSNILVFDKWPLEEFGKGASVPSSLCSTNSGGGLRSLWPPEEFGKGDNASSILSLEQASLAEDFDGGSDSKKQYARFFIPISNDNIRCCNAIKLYTM